MRNFHQTIAAFMPGTFITKTFSGADEITVTKPGYVFVTNESLSTSRIFYDDLAIDYTPGPVVHGGEYYPPESIRNGLAFNSYQQAGEKANDFLYNGKERQDAPSQFGVDLGWMDYGARMYSPDIVRWNVIDASSGNYVNQSPYHYAGNNPEIFVDYNGNDYGVSVNHDSKTITISATYFASVGKEVVAASRAAEYYNNLSGQNYIIDCQISVVDAGAEYYDQNGKDSLIAKTVLAGQDKSGEANIFTVVSGKDSRLSGNNGTAYQGKDIMVKDSRKNTDTSTHEVGHTLGMTHSSDKKSLLRNGCNYDENDPDVQKSDIQSNINAAFKGTTNTETGAQGNSNPAGKGTVKDITPSSDDPIKDKIKPDMRNGKVY